MQAEEWSPISSPDMSPRNHHFGDDDLSRVSSFESIVVQLKSNSLTISH